MPFSLTNAPAVFQRFINTVFADLLDVSVVVYLDDIPIFSEDKASHEEHVQEVLQHLHKHGLYAKPEKCKFNTKSTEYLRYQLSPTGLTISFDKVWTILDWPEPQKVKNVQSFLSFANFYHYFIYNYSDIVTLLTHLTHKGVPWTFTNSCHTTFQQLKEVFTSAPILIHWVPDTPMIVKTDASDYAITGILSIGCTNKEIQLVTYYS